MGFKSGMKSVFGTVTPFLAQTVQLAVPGPLGVMAASILSKVTGSTVKPEQLHDKMTELASTPEGLLQLKEAENQYQLQATALGFDHEDKIAALEVQDRDSARKMQIATGSWVPAALAIIFTLGFFTLLILMAAHKVSVTDNPATMLMLGTLTSGVTACLGFFLGSTHGSARATELLSQAPPIKQ